MDDDLPRANRWNGEERRAGGSRRRLWVRYELRGLMRQLVAERRERERAGDGPPLGGAPGGLEGPGADPAR